MPKGTGNGIGPAGDLLETQEQIESAAPGGAICNTLNFMELNGAPERIRTSDPQIRSLVLYPAELRAPFRKAPLTKQRGLSRNCMGF